MLRVLLFVEATPLPDQMFRNSAWLTWPLYLVDILNREKPDAFEFHLFIPNRFVYLTNECSHIFGERIYTVNESEIVKIVTEQGFSLRQLWKSNFLGATPLEIRQSIDALITRRAPSLDWDVVLSFGAPCQYSFARDAMRISMESSPFSRFPFKPSFFLDHCGLYRESAPSRLFRGREPAESTGLAASVRRLACNIVSSDRTLSFHREYEKYLLLPLQASGYPSFDAQCAYESQLDYLFDVCSQLSNNVGLVVTEHPDLHSFHQGNEFSSVLLGLSNLFPHVTYLPRARYLGSPSLQLLGQVEGVWTIASNVGPAAGLLGIHVGSPPESHIAYSSTASTIRELEKLLDSPTEPRAVFDWMLGHYVIPWDLAARPGWLYDYLIERVESFKQYGETLESFCPINPCPGDFVQDGAWTGKSNVRSPQRSAFLESKVELFGDRERRRLHFCDPGAFSETRARSFVVMNQTAELESYRHLGCNHVFAEIRSNMQRRGFSYQGAINDIDDLSGLGRLPYSVLVNGEGSFHHNSSRIESLLMKALDLKREGAKVALINTTWESNQPDLAEPLRYFDIVSVRDSASKKALGKLGIDSFLTPDLSLAAWRNAGASDGDRCDLVVTDSVIFERSLALFDAALILDGDYLLLDDRQIVRFDEESCLAAASPLRLSPDLLTSNAQIARANIVLTGRFHVALARMALKLPFVFVDSNTRKISNLCIDAGLPEDLLNVTSMVLDADWHALRKGIEMAKKRFPCYSMQLDEYRRNGVKSIERLFSLIEAS
jgi:hypothetical protein